MGRILKCLELRVRRQEESGDNGTHRICVTLDSHPMFYTCKNHLEDRSISNVTEMGRKGKGYRDVNCIHLIHDRVQ